MLTATRRVGLMLVKPLVGPGPVSSVKTVYLFTFSATALGLSFFWLGPKVRGEAGGCFRGGVAG